MINTVNLTKAIHDRLPAELVGFLHQAGKAAAELDQKLYLVGGVVRDLLLKRTNLDLDLVSEGDAIQLAEELAKYYHGRVVAHSRFNTAKIKWEKWSVDIATARAEAYEKPGALPSIISHCDLKSDLSRRDFTINAMAVYLDPDSYGELVDLFHGQQDLELKLVRILHDNSFRDDATRIWRAARYEQRLNFHIEPHTLDLIHRDIEYLDTITGDRIRHELELCLEEERPENVLVRATELGILGRLCPSLKADDWVARKIAKARNALQPYCPPEDVYLAFLVYNLTQLELEDLIVYLKFPRAVAQVLQDTLKLKQKLGVLAEPGLPASRIYRSLHPYSQDAIVANLLASDNNLIQERIKLYLSSLRQIHPFITGEELVKLGVAFGPRIHEILEILLEARLDGRTNTREDELEMVKKLGKIHT